MGKIFDALEKFAKESGYAKRDAIRQSDYEILMKFDSASGKLKVDSAPDRRDHRRLKRLMTYRLVREDGTLTPAGRAKYEEIKRRHPDPVPSKSKAPPRVEGQTPPKLAGAKSPDLTASDWAVLMNYDRNTGNLLKYDPDTNNLDRGSRAILKDAGTIQRLIDHNLMLPGGWLTPEAKRGCIRIEEKLKSKQFEDSAKPEKSAAAGPPVDSTPAAMKPSAGEKLPKVADKKQTADLAEKSDKGISKVIHLRNEAPKLRKVDKQPVIKEDAPEPAVKEPKETARKPEKTPVAKDPQKAARVKPVITEPQKPAKKAPTPEPVAKPPAIPEKLPETRADKTPDKPKFVPGKALQGFDRNALDKNLVSLLDPQSFEAEQFKILRTNLLFPESGRSPRSVMVTSALPGEGKSFVAANLAISVARHVNWNVLLVDCDLRRPSIHRQFGYQESPGLSDYLSNGISLQPLLLRTSVDNLTILPGGKPPHNPSELLSSDRMSAFLKEVATRYHDRLIIVDSPPPRLAAESGALARLVDGIILVVKYAGTSRDLVSDLIDKIGKDKVLGAIINRFEGRSSLYKSHYYGK